MAELDYKKQKILVIDDQRPFVVMMRGIFNNLGAKSITMANSGESAVSICKKERFDIIVADVHLGNDKKNGYQLLEELKLLKLINPDTLFIMVSGDAQRPLVLGSLERQPDDFLIKPFSLAQISTRITKAYIKKQSLKDVYTKVMEDDFSGALDTCRELIRNGCRYKQACLYLMTELYWKLQQYTEAEHMLTPIVAGKAVPWAKVALARTQMHLQSYEEAIKLAEQIVQARLLDVEGLDILANCYKQLKYGDSAINAIQKALSISPYSLERQYLGVEIAREVDDYEFARACCKAIFEQSRRSVHRNIDHMCNFVRSILDAAEQSEEKSDRNKYQQEALLTMQRLRNDETVTRTQEPFDYGAFEGVINARINLLDGKLIEAKRNLLESQQTLEKQFDSFPLALVPDSVKVMTDLGEYDEAAKLSQMLEDSERKIDINILHLLEQTKESGEQNRGSLTKLKNEGLDAFNKGKYKAAYEAFSKALKIAPVNVEFGLYVLQSLVQILGTLTKPDFTLILDCKKTYKLVNDLPLPEAQQKKLDELKRELRNYMDL